MKVRSGSDQKLENCNNYVNKVVADQLKTDGISLDRLKGLGITNQRETTVVWHRLFHIFGSLMLCMLCLKQFSLRKTGKPLNNAIVWCDARNGVQVLVANIYALKCYSLPKVGQLHAKYGQDHLRAK